MARRFVLFCAVFILLGTPRARADTLTFSNGDRVSGKLERADAQQCIFASTMAGTVTASWSRIREVQTATAYVVITADGRVLRGTLDIRGGTVEVESTPPAEAALARVRIIVDGKTYAQAAGQPRPWQGWRGQVTGGFSQVSATQSSANYTSSIDLQRSVPELAWLPQQSNTVFHLEGTYGRLSQPAVATVRTSILTTSLEQDQDLTARFFVFARGQLDHDIAQGLDLQQSWGGGAGWKLIDKPAEQLALKADVHWSDQRFLSAPEQAFLASSFTESLRATVPKKLVWTENVSLTPAYNNGSAYQMSGLSAWAVPVYHALSLNLTVVDSYINNPQPGYLKNSLQVSTGLQYTLP